MATSVDLSQLAVDHRETAGPAESHRRGFFVRWIIRCLIPLGLVLSFVGMIAWAARDSLLPAQAVTVVPVLVAKAQVQRAGTPIFQAAGWVEPSPTQMIISSLAPGVVEELKVVEGQFVEAGDVIARLVDIDARLAVQRANAELELRQGELALAQGELESAQLALENPVVLHAELADAESSLAEIEAILSTLPSAIKSAEAQHHLAEENLAKKTSAGNAIAGRVLRDARAKLAGARAELLSLNERQPVLERQRTALTQKCDALRAQLRLKLDATRTALAAKANLQTAQARLTRARLDVEFAELQLTRTVIKSPLDARVLSIAAPPGKRVNGLNPHSEQGSSAIVALYDPSRLQVRVDVRLEDVPQVQIGQEVQIETAAVPEGLTGKVVTVTSMADIQKNTLQVKAVVTDPPDVLRPEMLAQVTFLAPPADAPADESEDTLRILVPRSLVMGAGSEATVWLADRDSSCAVKRPVTLGRAGTRELVEITDGLTPTDRLISSSRETLATGARIRIVAEDTALGSSTGDSFHNPSARTAEASGNTNKH